MVIMNPLPSIKVFLRRKFKVCELVKSITINRLRQYPDRQDLCLCLHLNIIKDCSAFCWIDLVFQLKNVKKVDSSGSIIAPSSVYFCLPLTFLSKIAVNVNIMLILYLVCSMNRVKCIKFVPFMDVASQFLMNGETMNMSIFLF